MSCNEMYSEPKYVLSWNEALSGSSTVPILRHTLQLIDNLSQDCHTSALIPPLVPRSLISLGVGIRIQGKLYQLCVLLDARGDNESRSSRSRRRIFTGSRLSDHLLFHLAPDESRARVCVKHSAKHSTGHHITPIHNNVPRSLRKVGPAC